MMVGAGRSEVPGRLSMAIFQRTLELAGVLSKVQPQLQRLHLVETPKKRHLVRNVVLVGSTIAAGAVIAGVVCGRRGCCSGVAVGNGADAQSSSPEQNAPDPEQTLA
jgi:hypothetical protein